jgi:hypothetical protein
MSGAPLRSGRTCRSKYIHLIISAARIIKPMITEIIRYSLADQRDAMSGENIDRCSSQDIIGYRNKSTLWQHDPIISTVRYE